MNLIKYSLLNYEDKYIVKVVREIRSVFFC